MKAIKVKDLKIGDVLTSGATIIEAPFHFVGDQNKKMKVGVRYSNGVEKIQIWGKFTTIGVHD